VSVKEGVEPVCIAGTCPIGFDSLTSQDLRLLEIRGLLVELHELHLADRICREYGVTLDDLKILANIEAMLKKLQSEDNPDGQS
jgi:hypothetical protein